MVGAGSPGAMPMDDGPRGIPTDEVLPLGRLAGLLAKALESEFFRRLAVAGHRDLRMPHAMVLALLPQTGARSGVLASLLGVTKQAVGEIVDDLERGEYVRRIADPADRRAKLIVPSPKGEAAFRHTFAILRTMDEEYATAIGPERYAAARAALVELIDLVEQGPPEPSV